MSRPFTFDRAVRLVITVAVIVALIWLIGDLENVLLPFCLACLISYILEPFVEFNQKSLKLKKRSPAVFITLGDGLIITCLLFYFIMPLAFREIQQMGQILKNYSGHNVAIPFLPDNMSAYLESKLNLKALIEEFESGQLGMWIDKGETIISVSVEFVIHSLEWLLTFIYVIFILLDYERLSKGFEFLIPEKHRAAVIQIFDDIKISMNTYFRSQLLIASCAAVLYIIGFSIVGLPMAIIMGLLVGILYMIPYFQYITLIPVAIICFIYSLGADVGFWEMLGKCGLVYVVSQCICDYILTPKIMGKTMGLNPAIILLSLSIWGTLLGILGMIIALPLTTLLLVYYKKVIIERKPLSSPTDLTKGYVGESPENSIQEK